MEVICIVDGSPHCGVHRRPRCGTSMPEAGAVHPIKAERNPESIMLRQSLMWPRCTCFRRLDATGSQTDTGTPQNRTIVHHVNTYDPVPNAAYSPYYIPTYPTAYVPATSVTSFPGQRFASASR